MRPRLYASSRPKRRLRCSMGMARVRTPIRPPHMPRQWPPPSRPRITADSSRGASSSMGFVFVLQRCFGCMPGRLIDTRLMLRILIVKQNTVGRAVQIVVLAAVHRPEKHVDRHGDDQQCNRDHDVERGHRVSVTGWRWAGVSGWPGIRVRRKALSTTVSELKDMPTAAQMGVIQPRAANGNMRPLYSAAHSRFSMMTLRVRRARLKACTSADNRLDNSTASALVFARSVAEPMATLMSAAASTGTSLTPSP